MVYLEQILLASVDLTRGAAAGVGSDDPFRGWAATPREFFGFQHPGRGSGGLGLSRGLIASDIPAAGIAGTRFGSTVR